MTNDAVSEPMGKVGIVWGGDPHAEGSQARVLDRAGGLIEALTKRGVAAEVIIYSDDVLEETRNRLLDLDAVLVWVDPIMGDGHDRTRLDALLRDVASLGVRVSTHPDVILKMGTKEVLVRTRDLPWGTDAHLYRTSRQMRKELPLRLGAGAARVLKQNRGNGGNGVWKVELARAEGGAAEDAGKTAAVGSDTMVRVLHALRGSAEEEMRLDEFIGRCGVYFSNSGCMVDQPYQPRLVDGMIRCYLVQGKVAGSVGTLNIGVSNGFCLGHPQTVLEMPNKAVLTTGAKSEPVVVDRSDLRFEPVQCTINSILQAVRVHIEGREDKFAEDDELASTCLLGSIANWAQRGTSRRFIEDPMEKNS